MSGIRGVEVMETTRARVLATGHATSLFLVVSYPACVAWDLLFPQYAMFEAWRALLPGFSWSLGGFLAGLAGSYLYGWWFALLWVPLHAHFLRRALDAGGA